MNKPVNTSDFCGLYFALIGDTGGRKQGRKTRVDGQMQQSEFMQYPRRRLSLGVLRFTTGRLIDTLGNLHLSRVELVLAEGLVILAANHFKFVAPALVLYASPRAGVYWWCEPAKFSSLGANNSPALGFYPRLSRWL